MSDERERIELEPAHLPGPVQREVRASFLRQRGSLRLSATVGETRRGHPLF